MLLAAVTSLVHPQPCPCPYQLPLPERLSVSYGSEAGWCCPCPCPLARPPPESLPDGYGPGARWRCSAHSDTRTPVPLHDHLLRASRTATAPERGGDAIYSHPLPPLQRMSRVLVRDSIRRSTHEVIRSVAAVISLTHAKNVLLGSTVATPIRLHLNDVECDRTDSSRLYSVPVSHHPPPRLSTGEIC